MSTLELNEEAGFAKLMGVRINLLKTRLICEILPVWWFVSGTAIRLFFVVQPIIRNAFANTKYVIGRAIALTIFHGYYETIRRIVLVFAYSRIITLALLGDKKEQARIRRRWRRLRPTEPSGHSN